MLSRTVRLGCWLCALAPWIDGQTLVFDNGDAGKATAAREMTYSVQADMFSLSRPTQLSAIRFWTVQQLPDFDGFGFAGSIAWQVYNDNAGKPGALVGGGVVTPAESSFSPCGYSASTLLPGCNQFDLTIAPLTLNAGTYWLGLHNGPLSLTNQNRAFFWLAAAGANSGAMDPSPFSGAWQAPQNTKFSFQLFGADATPLPRAGVLSHIAAGGGWETSITLINLSSADTSVQVNFWSDSGVPLTLPLTYFQVGKPAQLTGSSIQQTIAGNAIFTVRTASPPSSQLAAGWAEVLAGGSVAAFGIFNSQPFAAPNAEATVALETRQPASWIVPYDNTAGFVTGLAIANTSSSPASLNAIVRDESGQQVATSPINLPAMGHTAFSLLDQFPALAGRAGTIQLQNPSGGSVAGLGLRFNPSGTFTSLPVAASTDAPSGGLARAGVLSQVAAGGDWQTAVTIVNLSAADTPVRINFWSDTGDPLVLPLSYTRAGKATQLTAASVEQTIPGNGVWTIRTTSQEQSQIVAGWAEILAAGNVAAFGIFNYQVPGWPNTEGTVALEARQPAAWIVPYDNSAGFVTGMAIANTSSAPTAVTAILRDESGRQVGTSPVNLAGMGHTAFSLFDRFPALSGRAGTILLQNTSGATSAALGLRFNPSGTFTSLPVAAPQ
jgi:hypothetical protein